MQRRIQGERVEIWKTEKYSDMYLPFGFFYFNIYLYKNI